MLIKKIRFILFYTICIYSSAEINTLLISPKPICTIYTPDSILKLPEKPVPFQLTDTGEQGRFSTCGGVAWFHEDYVAIINFGGNNITTYKIDKKNNTAEQIQILSNKDGIDLDCAENITFSKNGLFLAISSLSQMRFQSPRITFYTIDPITHLIDPLPIHTIYHNGTWGCHGVRFSPISDFFAFTTIDQAGSVSFYRTNLQHKKIILEYSFTFKVKHQTLRPKAISFTLDEKFVAIQYAPTFGNPGKTVVEIYTFDKNNFQLGSEPTCSRNFDTVVAEDVIFIQNNTFIALSDQIGHKIISCSFDKETGELGEPFILLKNPEAKISFPHGIGLSKDEKYLAVSNYGDDKLTIYALE
jgi:hypothetical protein